MPDFSPCDICLERKCANGIAVARNNVFIWERELVLAKRAVEEE